MEVACLLCDRRKLLRRGLAINRRLASPALLLFLWSIFGRNNKEHKVQQNQKRLPEHTVYRKNLAKLTDLTKDGVPEFFEALSCMPLE